jgi:uncharacterized protein (TIGR02145 family)
METSFIVFNVIALIVVIVAAFRIGAVVNKAQKKEDDMARNNASYEDCLCKNTVKFNYDSFTDSRDGETYRTVKIGNQIWMVDNLRFKTEESYAPGNDEMNIAKYGRLYTWTGALGIPADFSEQSPAKDMEMYHNIRQDNYQGIAPDGWHIPSYKEWEQLLENLPKNSNGDELRSECFWGNPGEDSFGFFALPAGYRFDNGAFCHFGKRARFWCKDEYGKSNAYRLSITNNSVDIEGVYRSDALSVRCVKNV